MCIPKESKCLYCCLCVIGGNFSRDIKWTFWFIHANFEGTSKFVYPVYTKLYTSFAASDNWKHFVFT
jgi:hypothetical protein